MNKEQTKQITFYDGNFPKPINAQFHIDNQNIIITELDNPNKQSIFKLKALSREYFAERNDEIRINLSKRAYFITHIDNENIEELFNLAPQLTITKEINKGLFKKIANYSLIIWALIVSTITIWPLIARGIAHILPQSFEAKVAKNIIQYEFNQSDVFETSFDKTNRPELQRINSVAQKISKEMGNSQNVKIYLNKWIGINAFTLPDNNIIMLCKLVEITDPDEFTFILAHEISHAKNRDVFGSIIRDIGIDALFGSIGAGDSAANLNFANSLVTSKSSRNIEERADKQAAQALMNLGYNANGGIKAFEKLEELKNDGTIIDEFLLTHPLNEARVKNIDTIIKKHGASNNIQPRNIQAISNDDLEYLKSSCRHK